MTISLDFRTDNWAFQHSGCTLRCILLEGAYHTSPQHFSLRTSAESSVSDGHQSPCMETCAIRDEIHYMTECTCPQSTWMGDISAGVCLMPLGGLHMRSLVAI